MSELHAADYELIQLNEAERQELIEAKRLEVTERFKNFNQKLFETVKSYAGDVSTDVKTILALNTLLQREFNQNNAYSLEGFEQIIDNVNNKTLLANNNFVYHGNNLADEAAIYLVLEPETVGLEQDENHLSNNEKIARATEIYEADKVDYSLYIYLKTDSYDVYQAMEEGLTSTLDRKFTIISNFPNIDMRNKADYSVDTFPDLPMTDMLNSFLTAFGLFSYRRKKVFFDYTPETTGSAFGSLDFLLLAQNQLSHLLLRPETVQPLAKHFTEMWLGYGDGYKHSFEEIEDFFNSPSIVLVKGLSPVYGFISGRKMRIKGAKLNWDNSEEELIDLTISDDGEIAGLHDESELRRYLKNDIKNLRHKLIRFKNDVIRVEFLEKIVYVTGKNFNNTTGPSARYELKGDLSAVTFLTPYFLADNYNRLLRAFGSKGVVSYRLPERFKTYLLRLAHSRGKVVDELDTRWFSKSNVVLPDVLETLEAKFGLDDVLGSSISVLDGVVNKNIIVSLEGLRCHIRAK